MGKAVRISGKAHPKTFGGLFWFNTVGLAFVFCVALGVIEGSLGSVLSTSASTALWYLAYYLTKRSFVKQSPEPAYLKFSPVKLRVIASVAVFMAIFIFAYVQINHNFVFTVVVSLMPAYGLVLYYGWPKEGKIENLPVGISQHKLTQLSKKADSLISVLKREVYEVKNQENKEVLKAVIKKVDALIDILEKDPKDLYSSRKLINIYLEQSVEITEKLNDAEESRYSKSNSAKYQKTMREFIEVIDEHYQAIQAADADALDTQIEVLKQRLEGEGL